MGTNLGLHGQEKHGSQYDMSCDNRENYVCDVCDSNTNSINDLDNIWGPSIANWLMIWSQI